MESLGQCKALNISDEKRCIETATSVNGLFCAFHSRQCQGLYRGYKLRNARLDKLSANPPALLANTKTPLSTQNFADVDSKEVCTEVHDHLFLKLQLLDRVIRARRLHHSRFFSMDMDYGHAKFLDILQGQRATIAKALERLEHRTAEVMYKHEQWFNWVRQCQNDEEENRDKEQKKVKQEAALFKRHWKAAEQRMRDCRAKEDKKRQDAFLDKIYKERLAEQDIEDDSDMDWDPIEDVLEDNRGNFIGLIQHFLWLSSPDTPASSASAEEVAMKDAIDEPSQVENAASPKTYVPPTVESELVNETPVVEVTPKSSKKKKKSKSKSKSTATTATPSSATCSTKTSTTTAQPVREPIPDKNLIETREEMRERLKNGTEYNKDKIVGVMVSGTMENPVIETKTISFPEHQITKLLEEVLEIKHFLFCRLLLSHATLLPIALRSNNVEEFLADPEVTSSALRDLCLKMERPGLQEIRDACADLFRSDEDEEEEDIRMVEAEAQQEDKDDPFDRRILKPHPKRGALPDQWISRRDRVKAKSAQSKNLSELLPNVGGAAVEFRYENQTRNKKVRVKICGRNVWNYPSDKAMHRGGWLQFCILAKDSHLQDAMELCRHWDEFFELNILAAWHYFPGANWAEWVGNRARQQMLQLGFIMYFQSDKPDAMDLTVRHQTGGRSSQYRRSHAVFEARNFICAHIKRDDQISRRLVQYLSMQSHRILVLVRDAESGKLLIKPPEDQRWLFREKNGLGRAAKNDWNIIKSIGPVFFEEMDRYRDWHFSFKQYYDVYIWDLEPGECFPHLYNIVQEMIFKAHRCRKGVDMYRPAEHILRTLYRDGESHRVYHVEAGDESKHTIWDELNSKGTRFFYGEVTKEHHEEMKKQLESGVVDTGVLPENVNFPRHLFYNEADVLEDAILFPEEKGSNTMNPLRIGTIGPTKKWEDEGLSLQRWANGADLLNSDTEESGSEDENEPLDEDDGSSEWEDDDTDEAHSDDGEPDPLMAKMFRRFMLDAKSKPDIPEPSKENFMAFLDIERAKIFKEVWHKADLEPNAQEHYLEMLDMVKRCRKFIQRDVDPKFTDRIMHLNFEIIDTLSVPLDLGRDLNKALCKTHPFFYHNFLDSELGSRFKDSLLFKQDERAKNPPDVRTHISNNYRSKEFWTVLDKETKKMKESANMNALPDEWDLTIRPIIAHLFKSGVLRTRADTWHAGQAFAATEPHRPTSDLFIDWRSQMHDITFPPGMVDPHSIPAFKPTASAFAKKNPNARFSILRLWSAAYFYPLMIGPDNHDPTSFRDLTGRNFIWMFVPKDMPCSEYSIHHSASQRIAPYKKFFGDRVVLKRDKYLILGKDEEECMMLTAAVTWCVQTKPWRWEVDLWKSFVNVDAGFVEELDNRWLD